MSVPHRITEDYAQEYKRVSYEGIKNVEDVLELTKHYFTEEIAEYLMEQKLWHESGGILYMSEPDGIGSVEPDYLNIEIHKYYAEENTMPKFSLTACFIRLFIYFSA